MGLSDAFSRTTLALNDLRRVRLGEREDDRLAALFPVQYLGAATQVAGGLTQLEAARFELGEARATAATRRRAFEIDAETASINNAVARLRNKAAKLDIAYGLEDRPLQRAGMLAGLSKVHSEIEGNKAQAEALKAQARRFNAQADGLEPAAAEEKGELYDISSRVSSVLDIVEEALGQSLPSQLYGQYEKRMKKALDSGGYTLDQLTDMMQDEVSSGLSQLAGAQDLAQQMTLTGGQIPGMPRLFGVPEPKRVGEVTRIEALLNQRPDARPTIDPLASKRESLIRKFGLLLKAGREEAFRYSVPNEAAKSELRDALDALRGFGVEDLSDIGQLGAEDLATLEKRLIELVMGGRVRHAGG